MNRKAGWQKQRVLVTGHTGFKGSWLSIWLMRLNAEVHGVSLPPETEPSLFNQLQLATRMNSHFLDIRDFDRLQGLVAEIKPTVIFHLAAQSLVHSSYAYPLETWSTNVMGTANVLEAATRAKTSCSIIVVTTDNVYRNKEQIHAYRETDPLGGWDPYSASKAASELLVDSWRKSFSENNIIRLSVARAGNVIGGGDWAINRILPDIVRALTVEKPIEVRNPQATRPWQHILDPLDGYLTLAEQLSESDDPAWQDAFNFGPCHSDSWTVQNLVEEVLRYWPGRWVKSKEAATVHEATYLALSIDKARTMLGWQPRWSFEKAVKETIDWYRNVAAGANPAEVCEAQITDYERSQ